MKMTWFGEENIPLMRKFFSIVLPRVRAPHFWMLCNIIWDCPSSPPGTSLLSPWQPARAHASGDAAAVVWWWRGDHQNILCLWKPPYSRGHLTWVPFLYRTCVLSYRLLAARRRHLAQLVLAPRHLGNTLYALRSHLLGNSPITPPSQPPRALPPFPAICLHIWTLNMLSHGPPLT